MTSRERVQALLRRELPDRMGLYEHFWGETLRDYWPAQGYPENVPPEVFFDYDIVNCGGWFDTAPFWGVREVIEESPEWEVVRDGRGATLKFWKSKSGTPEHIAFDVTTPEKWRKYREPLLEVRKERLGDIEALRKRLTDARAGGKFAIFGNVFVFELMRYLIGDENFLPALLSDPDWIHDVCRVYLDHYRSHYQLLFREAGLPDGFLLYEDFGYNKGLFCSPRLLADIIMPYEKAFVSFLKEYGLPVIIHSCGDIRKAIPLIIDAGFDCLQPMEAKAGCDVVDIARTYGKRISYMGNMNVVVLGTNDEQSVRNEVEHKIRALKEMRIPYFFHSDHSIPPDVTMKTYEFALTVFRDNSRYDYRR